MAKWNSIYLEGNVGKDSEQYGKITKFSIAVYTGKDKPPMWVNIVSFHNTQYKKGQSVCITGSLSRRDWEKDGKKGVEWSVVADKIELRGKKQSSDDDFLEE
jgi:single-stranded DNA-binding protein